MNKALELFENIKFHISCIDPNYDGKVAYECIETALITNKRKLDVIGEILVDVSKGNYADVNDAIDEIREVLL